MKSFKYLGLIIGITLTILSFLFFGRKMGVYNTMLLIGLIASLIFYLIILFKNQWKNKIIWTIIIVISILIERLTEPVLIKHSWKIFISKNEKLLDSVNNIFISSRYPSIYYSKFSSGNGAFSIEDTRIINKLMNSTDISLIVKDSSKIYYEHMECSMYESGYLIFIPKQSLIIASL